MFDGRSSGGCSGIGHRTTAKSEHLWRARETEAATALLGAPPERRDAIARELDGVGAIMESHFAYEERRIGVAIDGLPEEGWASRLFGLIDSRHAW